MSLEPYGQSHKFLFADLLRQHRIAAALSQEALAEHAGISARAVSDLERGVKQRPHLETVRLLADALGLTRLDRTEFAIASRPAQNLPAEPAARAHDSPTVHSGLPVPATPLVGRSDDARSAASLIREDRVRLLTLSGPGGVGKTRLALATATELNEAFADGVAWIELAPVSDPLLIPAPFSGCSANLRSVMDHSVSSFRAGRYCSSLTTASTFEMAPLSSSRISCPIALNCSFLRPAGRVFDLSLNVYFRSSPFRCRGLITPGRSSPSVKVTRSSCSCCAPEPYSHTFR